MSGIAPTLSQLVNAGVAAGPIFHHWPNFIKQFLQNRRVLNIAGGQSPRVQITAPGQGNQLFGNRLNSLGFGFGGFDFIVPEQLGG
jgi:hypothetical protein